MQLVCQSVILIIHLYQICVNSMIDEMIYEVMIKDIKDIKDIRFRFWWSALRSDFHSSLSLPMSLCVRSLLTHLEPTLLPQSLLVLLFPRHRDHHLHPQILRRH